MGVGPRGTPMTKMKGSSISAHAQRLRNARGFFIVLGRYGPELPDEPQGSVQTLLLKCHLCKFSMFECTVSQTLKYSTHSVSGNDYGPATYQLLSKSPFQFIIQVVSSLFRSETKLEQNKLK